jgi:SAM-dependent methyltransferase
MLPRLKLPPSRVLVLGCGSGNDAAHFAKHGHFVTAVDISPEAIQRGKTKYGEEKNLRFIQEDIFRLPTEMYGQFDLIFEHTCFCAIDPRRRNELISLWKKFLTPQGHLLAIFFTMEKRGSPPFGGSEWELRERLKKSFQFVFWGRWRQSVERRLGKELLVYAQKKSG